jgi:hypothetical protein
MHAFPATGGNVAVSHGGNGAGSIADASGAGSRESGAGAGVSWPRPKAASGGDARESQAHAPAEGEVVNVREPLSAQQFPPLPSAEERKRERQAQEARLLFFTDKRKDAEAEREKARSKLLRGRERASPKNRGKRGVAKQRRIKELQRKLAKRMGEGVEEERRREAEEGEEVQAVGTAGSAQAGATRSGGSDASESEHSSSSDASDGEGGATVRFSASSEDGDTAPAKSVLSQAIKRRGVSGGTKSEDEEPPQELVEALLGEFPHANEKQAIGALHMSRAPREPGKPGWRVVHAAKLLPPAPLGARSNPIALSSDSSPDAAAKEAKALRANKVAWCKAVSLSLDVEELLVEEVFDTYKPRSIHALDNHTIGVLAEELEQDPFALVQTIREHRRETWCKQFSLSFGIGELVVAEVFELHQPCTYDELEGLTIQAMAESVNADIGTFTHTIRERQRKLREGQELMPNINQEGESHGERAKAHPRRESQTALGCKPSAGHPRNLEGSDDEASGGPGQATARRMSNSAQAAWAVARGQVAPFTGAAQKRSDTTSSASGGQKRTAAGAAEQAQAGNGGHGNADTQTHQNTVDTRERESKLGAPDNAAGASDAGQAGGATNMREHGGNDSTPKKPNAPSALTFAHCGEGGTAAQGCNGHCGRGEATAAGAQPSATNTRERREGPDAPSGDGLRTPVASTTGGAAEVRERGSEAATGGPRVRLTREAQHELLELHNGDKELLTPLDGSSELLRELVSRLQAAVGITHGLHLSSGVALVALEVARHRQGAEGWPSVDVALQCLQRYEGATSPTGVGGNGGDASRQTAPPTACNAPTPTIRELRQRAALEELRRIADALGEGVIPDSLRGILEEGKFPGKGSAQANPSTANAVTSCVHPSDARRATAAAKLRTLLDGAAAATDGGTAHPHLSDCDPTGTRGGLSRATCKTVNTGDCDAYERELAASLARRRQTGTCSCNSDSSCFEDGEGERERELQRKREQRKQALTPGKQEGAGGTPASARLGITPKDYQTSLNKAADELDRKVSEAVAAAMKAALPQLCGEPQDDNDGNLLQSLRAHLASPDLRGLGKREALAIAAKRAARNLESELMDAHSSQQRNRRQKHKRKHCGDDGGLSNSDSDSDSDSGSMLSSSDSDHSRNRGQHNRGVPFPSPAARAAAMNQLPTALAAPMGAATVVVVGNTKLPVWRMGSEANLQGFNWKTKQHIYHLWEQYMLAEGQHAPKEFKSLIAPELIPVICAETGLRASDWPFLQDSLVIAKIDKALRPTRSTDFALQLQQITLSNGKPGTLLQRYRQFAERFLSKVAEAEAAERPVKDNVVKDAFKDALTSEGVLKMWMREVDWRGVGKAHRRLMRKLKESHSWDKLRDENERKGANKWRKDENGERAPKQWQRRQQDDHVEANFAASKDIKTKGGEKFLKGKRPSEQKEASSPVRGPQPGLDKRGPSWHTSTNGITCRYTPCKSKFCQRCGNHGHTAETCRMSDDTPGINLQGYFQDKKGKEAQPVSRGSKHEFGPPPKIASNAAQRKGDGKGKASKKSKGGDDSGDESASQ